VDKVVGMGWEGSVVYEKDVSRPSPDGWARRVVTHREGGAKHRFTITGRADPFPPGAKLWIEGTWAPPKGDYPPDLKCDVIQVTSDLEQEGRDGYVGYLIGLSGPAVADLRAQNGGDLDAAFDNLDELVASGIVSGKVADAWRDAWAAGCEEQLDLAGLAGKAGIKASEVAKLYRDLGERTVDALVENPYGVMRVADVDFRRADLLAAEFGFGGDDPARVEALVWAAIEVDRKRGSTASVEEDLANNVERLDRSVSLDAVSEAIQRLEDRKEIDVVEFGEEFYVQSRSTRRLEHAIASKVSALIEHGVWYQRSMVERHLDFVLEKAKADGTYVPLDHAQANAVIEAARSPVALVYGGGGTGKSTLARYWAGVMDINRSTVERVAPTATAAERMGEVTEGMVFKNRERTISLFLGARADGSYKLGPDNLMPPNTAVWADELSLASLDLGAALFSAVGPSSRVFMTLDPNQLGSVDEGAVGRDLIRSGLVPAFKLVGGGYRTGAQSGMAAFGEAILSGQMPDLPEGVARGGILFIPTPERSAPGVVLDLIREGVEDWRNFKVICPTRELLGKMNGEIQQLVNPGGRAIRRATPNADDPLDRVVPRVGDLVRHCRTNIYEKADGPGGVLVPKVLNGHTGWIKAVTRDGVETVMGRAQNPVLYQPSEVGYLVTGYGGTVHETQGSQFKRTILVLGDEGNALANRQTLYTGGSRWRELLVIVAQRKTIEMYVRSAGAENRRTLLQERLQHCFDYRRKDAAAHRVGGVGEKMRSSAAVAASA